MLREALTSALGQTDCDDFEVVVIDDCSDDQTWSFLQSVRSPRLHILRNEHRLGMGPNWRKVVQSSRGRLIFILQDDDIAMPQLLSVSSMLFERHKGAELLCFATCLIDQAGQNPRMFWQIEQETRLPAPEALLRFAGHWTLSSTQVVFSRDLYERHADFDLTLPIMSDADTILRWMIHADTILYPEPLALRRIWPGSVSATTQHSPEMAETMKLLVRSVWDAAALSKKLDRAQLDRLHAGLQNSFIRP
jgi:glycosyltransferase involved in cell wall biosynthesis